MTPQHQTTPPDEEPLARSVLRFRVMAVITGVFLLLVFAGVFVEYVVKPSSTGLITAIDAVQTVHGVIYLVYVVSVVYLWTRASWGWGRLLLLLLGGIVPVLSFVLERRVSRELTPAGGA